MRRAFAVAVAMMLMACVGEKQRAADTTAASAARSLAATPSTPVQGPGDLTKALATYTGDEFFTLVRGVQFTGPNTRPRRCRGCTGAQRASVTVDARDGSHVIADADLGQFGTVVVRARNSGPNVESMFGMRPGARYEYYLVIRPDTGGITRWHLAELDIQGTTRALQVVDSGRVRGCGHALKTAATADFRSCDSEAIIRPASFVPLQSIDDPLWYSCPAGCCVTER